MNVDLNFDNAKLTKLRGLPRDYFFNLMNERESLKEEYFKFNLYTLLVLPSDI